jgi:hypothetical protein
MRPILNDVCVNLMDTIWWRHVRGRPATSSVLLCAEAHSSSSHLSLVLVENFKAHWEFESLSVHAVGTKAVSLKADCSLLRVTATRLALLTAISASCYQVPTGKPDDICKIWGFHGGDYEDCRLMEHKNPVPTSQETHYFSATESSQLMLCKIWGFHGDDYEEYRSLECDAVWLL